MNKFVKFALAGTIAAVCALAVVSPSEAQSRYYGRGGALGFGGGNGFADATVSYGYAGSGSGYSGYYGAYASAGPFGYRDNNFLCNLSPALIIYVPCETWGGAG